MTGASKTPAPVGPAFRALVGISFLCFANLAFFYGFYNYLAEIGIPPEWRGPLLAMEPVTALVLRPFLSVVVHPGNATRTMMIGAAIAGAALLSYPLAGDVSSLVLVRLAHGVGYVTLASGMIAAYTRAIPEGRAAWAYGLLSLTSLLPAAVLPSIIEIVQPRLAASGDVYALAAVLIALVFPLLLVVERGGREASRDGRPSSRPSLREIGAGLARPGVAALTAGYLAYVAAHTIVYFFAKSWAVAVGAANPGLFFLCANAATIVVRIVGMNRFERVNPARVAGTSLLCLAVVIPSLALATGPAVLFSLAAVYGLFLGLGMPLFNTAMYRLSSPELRAVNTNLMMSALDAGFILGPLIGGAVLAAGASLPALLVVDGALMLAAATLVLSLGRYTPAP